MNTNSLVNKTLDSLMEVIFATDPGCTIPPQEELSVQFGVSRTVLREALSKLEYLNVISVRPKTGSKVNPPAEWRVINDDVLRWREQATRTATTEC
jgi:DNA-binding FadR family transcriptional regulator